MPTRFWARDAADWRYASANLHGYDGTAWRRVRKGWSYDGAAWRQVYGAATLASLIVSRDACTTNAGHDVDWTTTGELTGWTITVERDIGSGYATLATGIDPTLGTYHATYGGGNAETGTTFRVSLVQGSRSAFSSPRTYGPNIPLC